jgi:hypothetical protein
MIVNGTMATPGGVANMATIPNDKFLLRCRILLRIKIIEPKIKNKSYCRRFYEKFPFF